APDQFFQSYLFAYLFWLGLALGSSAIVLLIHLAGGAWGFVIRRILESAAMTLPLMLVLFVPIVLGMGALYEWTHPDLVERDPVLLGKSAYLNVEFFLIRAAIYFVVWIGIAYLLN